MSEVPYSLFKYQKFNSYSLLNLKNSELYFNKPIDFNDPFDCAVCEQKKLSSSDINKLDKIFKKENPKYKKAEIKEEYLTTLNETISKSFKKISCCCFSKSNKEILMWSHYADSHRGFCLEFSTVLMSV